MYIDLEFIKYKQTKKGPSYGKIKKLCQNRSTAGFVTNNSQNSLKNIFQE